MSKIKIRFGISPTRNNNEDDVLQLKKALKDLSFYDEPKYGITPYADDQLFSSIKNFQQKMGLKVDGVVNPNGETERSLDKLINTSGNSPIIRCPICNAPHGGVYGDVCPDCTVKSSS